MVRVRRLTLRVMVAGRSWRRHIVSSIAHLERKTNVCKLNDDK